MSTWSITMGSFTPEAYNRVTGMIHTPHKSAGLADALIAEHMVKHTNRYDIKDYRVSDFSDEVRIDHHDGKRWRCLINLQLESI